MSSLMIVELKIGDRVESNNLIFKFGLQNSPLNGLLYDEN